MTRMDDGEVLLRELVARTKERDRVGSVASICEATGLSTGAAIAVVHRLVDEGLVRSTRGPNGGYWRTDAPVAKNNVDLRSEAATVAAELRRLSLRVQAICDQL